MNPFLSEKAEKVLELAEVFNASLKAECCSPEELLLAGCVMENTGIAAIALKAFSLSEDKLRDSYRDRKPASNGDDASVGIQHYLAVAAIEAVKLSHPFIGTEHILLSLTTTSNGVHALESVGVPSTAVRAHVLRLLGL